MFKLGQFGLVYKAKLRTETGGKVDVAVKTIREYDSKKETKNFMSEMAVMSMLIHPPIIRLHGVVKERKLPLKYSTKENLHYTL